MIGSTGGSQLGAGEENRTETEELPSAGRQDTRQRLLLATLEIIDELGIERATTRRIAERAEANLQLIQYYFGGKAAMVAEAQQHVVSSFRRSLDAAIADAPDLVSGVRAGMMHVWRMAQENPPLVQPDLLMQYMRAAQPAPEGDAHGLAHQRTTQRHVAEMIEAMSERTGDRLRVPVDQFALLMAAGLGGLILEYRMTGDGAKVGAALETFTEMMVSLIEPA